MGVVSSFSALSGRNKPLKTLTNRVFFLKQNERNSRDAIDVVRSFGYEKVATIRNYSCVSLSSVTKIECLTSLYMALEQ